MLRMFQEFWSLSMLLFLSYSLENSYSSFKTWFKISPL